MLPTPKNPLPKYAEEKLMQNYGKAPSWLETEFWAPNAAHVEQPWQRERRLAREEAIRAAEALKPKITIAPKAPLRYEKPDLTCPPMPNCEVPFTAEVAELFWAVWNGKLFISDVAGWLEWSDHETSRIFSLWKDLVRPEAIVARHRRPKGSPKTLEETKEAYKAEPILLMDSEEAMFLEWWQGKRAPRDFISKFGYSESTFHVRAKRWADENDIASKYGKKKRRSNTDPLEYNDERDELARRCWEGYLTKKAFCEELGITAQIGNRYLREWQERKGIKGRRCSQALSLALADMGDETVKLFEERWETGKPFFPEIAKRTNKTEGTISYQWTKWMRLTKTREEIERRNCGGMYGQIRESKA